VPEPTQPAPVPMIEPSSPPSGVQVIRTSETSGSLMGKKIVLDPGHGGTDKGAPGGGLYEANLNLTIATKAAELLRKQGAIVTLTRDTDTFVDLRKRASFSAGQDLFLSVHIDSSVPGMPASPRPFTVRVWFHGAVGSPAPDPLVQMLNVLLASANACNDAQEILLGSIAPDGKVYSAGLSVLRNATCPAYLIDFGNISYPEDVSKLRDPKFLDGLAQGIVEGAKTLL
jgi:N-acetylmuramoyl-L-alanine amidase